MGANVQSQAAQTDDGVQVVLQSGHAQEISITAMSPDGRQILTGSHDGTVKLWDVASGQELRTFSGFATTGLIPDRVTFSGDGHIVVISDGLQTHLFDGASGLKINSLSGSAGSAIPVFGGGTVVASGGQFAAKSTASGRIGATAEGIDVLELATGRVLWTTPKGDMQLSLALSDDGKVLLSQRMTTRTSLFGGAGGPKTSVQVWDVGAKKSRGTLPFLATYDARGIRLVLSPDGRYVIVEAPNTPVRLYSLESAEPIATLAPEGFGYHGLHPFAFSADGARAVRATPQGIIEIYEIPSGKPIAQIPGKSASFGPNGNTLVIGVEGAGAPVIHDIATGRNTSLSGGAVAVWALATLTGGRSAAAVMQDGSTRLWDLATGQLQRNLDCADGSVALSVVSNASGGLVVGCSDGSAWQWAQTDAAPNRVIAPLTDLFGRTLVRFSADGRRTLVARNDSISIRDTADGSEIRNVVLPAASPRLLASSSLQLDADERKAWPKEALEAMDRQAAALADPKLQAQIQAGANSVVDVAIHPNGRWFVVARSDDVSVWDMQSGTLLRTVNGAAAEGDARDTDDPTDDSFTGASQVVFRNDGVLLTIGDKPELWDVSSGRRIRSLMRPGAGALMYGGRRAREREDAFGEVRLGVFSPDGRIVALADRTEVRLQDSMSGAEFAVLRGHRTDVRALAFTPDGQRLLSGGSDGTLHVWSIPRGEELVQLIALGRADFVAVTPDQYYRASKSRIKGVAFRVNGQVYPFEQFDLRFNRPDIVLERLGLADADSIQTYRLAYQRRLKKLGFTEEMLGTDFHLPSVAIASEVPVSTPAATLSITVEAQDDRYALDRLQVFINDVPIHGTRGVAIAGDVHEFRTVLDVPLVAGRNKIQVSALNRQGAESLRQTAYTNATGVPAGGDIYLVTIGVSQYANAAYNLRYAAKDAGDFAAAYSAIEQSAPAHGMVHVLSLTNERATREEIRAAKQWLSQAKVGDLAIVFAAGHGMTDAASNYYFGTYDIDPQAPSTRGLPYEDFEALLDGVAPLRKMLLIDTCFSGEIDKDDVVVVAQADESMQGQVKMRAFKTQRGVQVVADDSSTVNGALNTAVLFQQDLFADLRRGTGAVVISSASGNEFAFEGGQWNNGVFTYALLQGLRNGAADADGDARITVGELQAYVIEQVRKLTAGGQNPTVRRENLDYDFEVY